MLMLNLVSPALKKELKHRHVFDLTKKACNILIVLVVFAAAYASLGWFMINNNYANIIEQADLSLGGGESYEDKVSAINSQVNAIAEIQAGYYPFSRILINLIKEIEPGISMTSIRISRDSGIIEMQGLAETRDKLLAFKNNLTKADMFDEINLPLSNILQKDDVNFEITAKLILDENK